MAVSALILSTHQLVRAILVVFKPHHLALVELQQHYVHVLQGIYGTQSLVTAHAIIINSWHQELHVVCVDH